jgi:hypothetical protein
MDYDMIRDSVPGLIIAIMAYLEFEETEGYLAFLRSKNICETHVDVHWVIGPRDERGAALISAYIVLSQQVQGSVTQQKELVSEMTTSCPLEERQLILETVQKTLNESKSHLENLGFTVHAGIWKA